MDGEGQWKDGGGIPGTTRGGQALLLAMFESAFNIIFRASLHALAYQHVTALSTRPSKTPAGQPIFDVSYHRRVACDKYS